jgi:hypothetical protein
MAIFTLTITGRTTKFGENAHQERMAVAELLKTAAQRIGSHSTPWGGQSIAEPGGLNGANVSYTFGAGSLNQGL